MVSCPLLPLSVGTDTPGPPKAANVHAHLERKLASSGAPLYRRKILRLLSVKQKGHSSPAAASRRNGGTASPLLTVS